MLLLGLDVGTTSVKAGIFETSGRQLAAVGQEHRIDHPAPDRAEIDAETYWQATVAAVRRALRRRSGTRRRSPRSPSPARARRSLPSTRTADRWVPRSSGWTIGPRRGARAGRAVRRRGGLRPDRRPDGQPDLDRLQAPVVAAPRAGPVPRRPPVPAGRGLHPPPPHRPLRDRRRRPVHVAALRHPVGRLVGADARGGGRRPGAAPRARRPGRSWVRWTTAAAEALGLPTRRSGRRRRHGPGRRGGRRGQRRGRHDLREHGWRPHPPGIRRPPRRRPDAPDARLRPLGARLATSTARSARPAAWP